MADVCLHLLGEPELEEKLLDLLLLHPAIKTFTSQRIASHGGHAVELNAAEQVLGRGDAILVLALLNHADAEQVLLDLRKSLAGSQLRYWLSPVHQQGVLS